MEFNEVVKGEDNSEVHENEQKMNKSRQDYRDTMTLIKMKMNKADTLIRQYNDKMKECDQLNEELSMVKIEKQDALSKYNITMGKLTKLELTNRKSEQTAVELQKIADEQKIKLNENDAHISQLLARIKEMEEKNSSLEDDLKAQKQEAKSVKVKVVEKKSTVQTKQQASQTNIVEKRDSVINTDPVTFESLKKKMLNKGINTEECRGKYNEPFPFFCKKCEKLIEPAPVDQILHIMSHKPPLLLPPESPTKTIKQKIKISEPSEKCNMIVQNNADQNPLPFENDDFTSLQEIENVKNTLNNEPRNSSFMEKDKLERRLKKLEEMMKKLGSKGTKAEKCCAKNVKFVVQIPNLKRPCEYQKHEKRKLKRLKPKSKKKIKNQSSEESGWKVESCKEFLKRKRVSQVTEEVVKKKKLTNQERIELFDTPEIVLNEEELKLDTPPSPQRRNSSPHQQNWILNRPTTMENIPLLANKNITEKHTVQHPVSQREISYQNKNEDLPDKTCPKPSRSLHKSRSRSRSAFDTEAPSLKNSKPRRSRSRSLQSDLYLSSRSVSRSPTRESLPERSTSIENRSFSKDSSLLSKSPVIKSRSRSPGVTSSSESCLDLPIKMLESKRICKNEPTRTLRSQKLNRYKSESGTKLQTKISSSLRLTSSKLESVTQVLNDSRSSFTLPAESIVSNEYNCLTKQKQNSSSGDDILIPQVINDTSITKFDDVLIEEFSSDDSRTKTNQLNLEESQEDVVKTRSDHILIENLTSIPKATIQEAPLANQKIQFSMQNSISDSNSSLHRKSFTSVEIQKISPFDHSAHNLTLDETVVENHESSILSSENDTSNFFQEQKGFIIRDKELISEQAKSIFSLSDQTTDKILVSKNVETVENINSVNKSLAFEEQHEKKENDSTNFNPTENEASFNNHELAESTRMGIDESFKSPDLHKTELGNLSSSIYSINSVLEEGEEIDDALMESDDNKQSVDRAVKLEEEKTVKFDSIAETEIEETRQLRSHNVVSNKRNKVSKAKGTNKKSGLHIGLINETNSSLRNTTIVACLNDFISNPGKSHKIQRSKVKKTALQKNETFIHELIYTIMEAEEWTTELHSQVVEQLLESQDLKTIAHFIIEHITDKLYEDEDFDKTHTPPAPIMTRSEQKLITLITSIKKIHPNFFDIMIHGLQYKLFRLSAAPLKELVVERLFRLLLVLNKLQKDREKVRILMCDAMYCLNVRAVNIIYVALICWPEVLPKYNSNKNDIVVDTIIHIIMNMKLNKPYLKLIALRKLLSTYYQYPMTGYENDDFKIKLLTRLLNNEPNVDIALLLMCKKMGPSWCLDNIIKQFKSMIGSNVYPSFYDPLTLLGNIMRSFPLNNTNTTIKDLIDQLCDVLANKNASSDIQEGSVSCLLSICKFNFEKIARSVINWEYNEDLRPATKDKLNAFFKQQTIPWWRKFVQNNFPFSNKVD